MKKNKLYRDIILNTASFFWKRTEKGIRGILGKKLEEVMDDYNPPNCSTYGVRGKLDEVPDKGIRFNGSKIDIRKLMKDYERKK